MSSSGVVTTLTDRGIGSSLNVSSTGYFVSTVPQHGFFETIVKESGLTKQPLLPSRISRDCIEAAMAHVALTRMCISENPTHWDADAIDGYLPSQLTNLLDSQTKPPTDNTSLLNEYNHKLLAMAGIGYPPQKSKAWLVIIAVIVIAVLFLIFH